MAVVGAGPVGLALALLMARRRPQGQGGPPKAGHPLKAAGLTIALAAQLQLKLIAAAARGADAGPRLALADQITVAAAAVGAQAAQQFHRLQQVGFALAIAADHQQPRRVKLQIQLAVIAELAQLQAMQPNGSGAV